MRSWYLDFFRILLLEPACRTIVRTSYEGPSILSLKPGSAMLFCPKYRLQIFEHLYPVNVPPKFETGPLTSSPTSCLADFACSATTSNSFPVFLICRHVNGGNTITRIPGRDEAAMGHCNRGSRRCSRLCMCCFTYAGSMGEEGSPRS